jgi:hypothetical protein
VHKTPGQSFINCTSCSIEKQASAILDPIMESDETKKRLDESFKEFFTTGSTTIRNTMTERKIKVTQYCKGIDGPITRTSGELDLKLCDHTECTNCRNLQKSFEDACKDSKFKEPLVVSKIPHVLYFSCKNQKEGTLFEVGKGKIPYCDDITCETCMGWKKAGEEMMEAQRKIIFKKIEV